MILFTTYLKAHKAGQAYRMQLPCGHIVADAVPQYLGEYDREYHETNLNVLFNDGRVSVALDLEHANDLVAAHLAAGGR